MLNYYIPILYTLKTRYNTTFHKISFFIMTLLPSLVVVMLSSKGSANIVDYVILFLVMQSVYECGYLFNDLVTVQYEKNPTNRIDSIMSYTLLKHLQNLLTARLVLATLLVAYIISKYQQAILVIPLLLVLLIDYTIHNFYRNRTNIITMCTMVSLKYFIPCVPFLSVSNYMEWYLVIFLSIPLIRTIEYAGKPRYNLKIFEVKDFEKFRVQYYGFLVLIIALVVHVKIVSVEYLSLPILMLLFRLSTYVIMQNSKVSNLINKNRKKNGV